MVRWYKTAVDAKVQYQNPALAFLIYDDEHHRFAFANMSLMQPDGTETERQGAIGVDHVAYTYASLRELFENYAQLKENGIRPYWCIHHGITASLYYADLDGNQIEFQVDSFSSSEEARAFMQAHWDANVLGVEFDPEDWLTQLRAGLPESDVLRRQLHQPVSPLGGEIARMSMPCINGPRSAFVMPRVAQRGR